MSVFSPSRLPNQDELQALIEEARQRAQRRRRRQIKIVLAALILVGAAIWVAVGRGGSGRPAVASGGARAAGDSGSLRPGDYWYTRTVVATRQPVVGIGVPVASETIETWVGTDWSWRQRAIEPSGPSLFQRHDHRR
ncbi:MAG: hypothetical protein JO039_11370 [Solirubrobacterales bacterium]|nr:hypothetical protein [Solirubrobacterales bacterium]